MSIRIARSSCFARRVLTPSVLRSSLPSLRNISQSSRISASPLSSLSSTLRTPPSQERRIHNSTSSPPPSPPVDPSTPTRTAIHAAQVEEALGIKTPTNYGPKGVQYYPQAHEMGKPSWRMRYLIYGLFAGGILFIISPSHSPFKDHVAISMHSGIEESADLVAWEKRRATIAEREKAPFEVPSSSMYNEMVDYIRSLQLSITQGIEELEAEVAPRGVTPVKFLQDSWERANNGGSGTSCVIQGGTVMEKGGVNVSVVHGRLPPRAVAQMRADHAGLEHVEAGESLPYAACGISLVLHANNPMAPTCHMNYRYFETYDPDDLTKPIATWFGGGSDLTPNYLFDEDAKHFHQTYKDACDQHGEAYYPELKEWCDKYFYIPHREEERGIGGVFFDDLDPNSAIHRKSEKFKDVGPSPADILAFVKTLGDSFLPAYLPILRKRYNLPYTEEHKRWQQIRRGRYVEFNLVNDRGTKFGLMTPGARVESILMTLPTTARWEYYSDMPAKDSEEERLMKVLRKPIAWL
ncbi:Coproporphyrinogen III oxidase [Mrakia frigida]|uniref:coproporphyrinogen III oxidase n=1 Tax=Mrakia frigida TaxID=29902 RepID=UPI003FCC0BC8